MYKESLLNLSFHSSNMYHINIMVIYFLMIVIYIFKEFMDKFIILKLFILIFKLIMD